MSKPHDRLQRIQVSNNQLLIAGRRIDELVQIVGQTPCFIYEREAITQRVKTLRAAMPEALKLHYAIKANPMPSVVQHMASLTDGLDVASHQEMLVALGTGTEPESISFAGPAKSIKELRAAVSASIIINIESVRELDRLYKLSDELGIQPKVALRVNPNFELKSSGMKMSGGAKPFGIDEEQIPDVLACFDTNHIQLKGFHIFFGSQNLNVEALMEAHRKTFELAEWLCDLAPTPPQHINIGGGLGIPYFPGENELNLPPITRQLAQLMSDRKRTFKHAGIVMELGRYLVGEAGYYICQITDKKVSRGQTFLLTNGGLNHHLANSGNFGQVIRKNYPVLIGNRVKGEEKEQVEIVGPLCTPLDILGSRLYLPKADVGDYVVVFQSGAYGATASPQSFLSHSKPKELLI